MKGKNGFEIVSAIAIVKWGQSYNGHLALVTLTSKERQRDPHWLAQDKNMPYIGKFKRISDWMLGTIDSVIINSLLKFGIYNENSNR